MKRQRIIKSWRILGLPHTKIGLLMLLVQTYAHFGSAQQTSRVSGRVLDEAGEVMSGVSVVVKHKNATSTFTDEQGQFAIEAEQQDKLLFTYVGFVSQEVAVGGKERLDIVMVESHSALDEVVVVGYGTQKKANLTGAVATMDSKQLSGNTNINIEVLPHVRIKITEVTVNGTSATVKVAYEKVNDTQTLSRIGVAWNTYQNPNILNVGAGKFQEDQVESLELESGEREYTIDGLVAGEINYIQAFARTNNPGNYYNYSPQVAQQIN